MEQPKIIFTNHVCLWLAVMAVSAFLASAMAIRPDFFEGIIVGKQWGLECAACIAALCVVPMLVTAPAFKLSIVDIAVALLALWVTVSEGLIHHGHYQPVVDTFFNVSLWLFIYVFVRLATRQRHFTTAAIALWLMVAFIISVWGLVQLYGLVPSQHALFRITGPFHNPGPFSGYVVAALPVALTAIYVTKAPVHHQVACRSITLYKVTFNLPATVEGVVYILLKYLSIGLVIVVLLVIPAARSRAAWLAAIAGALYVAWVHPAVVQYRKKGWSFFIQQTLPLRSSAILCGVALFITIAWGLYAYKAGSADGRWLMWQVTDTLIGQSPVIGHGSGAFDVLYMPAQAEWFQSGQGTAAQALVAGSPEAPFNELLKLWLEYGAVAIALAVAILLAALRGKPGGDNPAIQPRQYHLFHRGLQGSLIVLLVFGLFSYPFDLAPHTLLLVMATALLAGSGQPAWGLNNRIAAIVVKTGALAALTALAFVWVPQRSAYYTALNIWQEAAQTYNMQLYGDAPELFAKALPVLGSNGLLLQMYGKSLNMAGQHAQSNEVLAKANKLYGSYIIYNTMGDNHKALGNAAEAEKAYRTAAAMVPGMMLPKYLLAKLYHDTGQTEKAQITANQVLDMPIKVKSMATDEILDEMRKIKCNK